MGKIRIGLSGWSYDDWKGKFYPEDLRNDDRLAFVARQFDTVEVNGTFYSLTNPASCRRWRDAAPNGFRFALKGSRFITHNKKLNDARSALANFFAAGILELGNTMGPILWQLPASARFDGDRLDAFFNMLPRDTHSAASLAREHDERVEQASYGDGSNHRLRHVLEFRHDTFRSPEAARLAQRHGIALAFSHSSKWPYVEEITAGFVYLRLHGPNKLYASGYGRSALGHWAERIRLWHESGEPDDAERISDLEPPERSGRDVYVYFDNDVHAYAPEDAKTLQEIIAAH